MPESVRHPGTPIYYLGAGLLWLTGTAPERAQAFFNLTYLVALVATIAGMAAFTRIALSRTSLLPAVASLAPVILWPSVLTYLNYFSVESFLAPLILPMLALARRGLDGHRLGRRGYIALGSWAGAGLACKLSILPLASVVVLALCVHALMSERGGSGMINRLRAASARGLLPTVSAGALFLAFTAPVLPRSYLLLQRLGIEIWRTETATSLSVSIAQSWRLAGPFLVFTLVLVFIIGAGVVSRLVAGPPVSGERLRLVTYGAIALGILLLLWNRLSRVHIPVGSPGGPWDAGALVRHVTPIALAASLLPLAADRVWRSNQALRLSSAVLRGAARSLAAGLVLASCVGTVTGYLVWRAQTYPAMAARFDAYVQAVERLAPAGTRIAVGDFASMHFGEPLFFLFADYRYAFNRFDERFLAHAPRYSVLHVQKLPWLMEQDAPTATGERFRAADTPAPESTGILRGPLQRWLDRMLVEWRARFPTRSWTRELFTGEDADEPVAMVLYPPGWFDPLGLETEEWLHRTLAHRHGVSGEAIVTIADARWQALWLEPYQSPPDLFPPAP